MSHFWGYLLILVRMIKRLLVNLFSKSGVQRYPFLLTIFITTKCKNESKCKFCWRSPKPPNREISISVIEKVAAINIPIVLISGGEPTEHGDFSQIIKILSDQKRTIYILTNATNSKIIVDSVVDKRETKVVISLFDFDTREDMQRKVDFARIMKEHKITVYLNIIVHVPIEHKDAMYDEIDNFKAYISRCFLTKYQKSECDITHSDIKYLNYQAHSIYKHSRIPILSLSKPNHLSMAIFRFVAWAMMKKYNECSGYPFRAFMSEDGDITDCPRLGNRASNFE